MKSENRISNTRRIIGSILALMLLMAVMFSAETAAFADSASSGGMRVEDGMARQIVRYTDAMDADYTNENSDILRFAVYVEMDYDTDLDGKPDLIKTLVQLPRTAAEGAYSAPVIYEARPYIAGMYLFNPSLSAVGTSGFDEGSLYSMPEKRIPAGEISTLELAARADPSDWYYTFDDDPFFLQYMGNVTTYDAYLVCGFAVVQTAGLGTWGSEGIECCTSELEKEAFKCVIEWLTGKRNAYADKSGNETVSAGWCSGKVGMIGRSYAGSMAYEVASTGVEGLETVVSIAGPASWYEYGNSQGIPSGLYTSYGYISDLASLCASRFAGNSDEDLIPMYTDYLSSLRDGEAALAGDYGAFWAAREYSDREGFRASALIIQGLNDQTVHPRQFDLMRTAFLRSGCEVKALLHRNGHVTPANEQTKTDIQIGEYTCTELINRWFTHYLLGADNGVEEMPALTVQSNLDGSFFGSGAWDTGRTLSFMPNDTAQHIVSAENAHMANVTLLSETFRGDSGPDRLLWTMDVTEPLTINGTAAVHIRAKTEDVDKGMLMLGAVLVDQADEAFACYDVEWSEVLEQELLVKGGVNRGAGVEPYDLVRWKQTEKNRAVIAYGAMDMRNPEAGYAPASATEREAPIEAGEWYDYTIYLQPNYYCVPTGHRLELYIVPFCGFSNDSAFYDTSTPEQLTDLGLDPKSIIPFTRDYSFTVDHAGSFAEIPVEE